MVDFHKEPEQHHHHNPIGELDMKIDLYYSSIYSKLYNHIHDDVVHITQEEREAWNNKASKDALKDLQDQLDSIAGEDGSFKKELLIEVTKQITEAIADLNLGEYAKKKYVDDAIKGINVSNFITKSDADSTYLKIVDYTRFDSDSYYTKAEVNNLLKNSGISTDYSITEFTIKNNKLVLTQKNGGQFEVSIPGGGSSGGSGITEEYLRQELANYIMKGSLAKLEINNTVVSLEAGGTIKIPTGGSSSNVDPTKFGYYKSYFKQWTSSVNAPSLPEDHKAPSESSGWLENAPNSSSGYYIWMTLVFINGNGDYGSYMNPICLTGESSSSAGEDGNSINFIFKTSILGESVENPGSVEVSEDGVPVVPSGWTDHPSGVTKDVPYEYCSIATSVKGLWCSQWSEPFVWSHFGQNGMDGDGVEYIFYASTLAPSNNLPSSWTLDSNFLDREYIRNSSGWTDDPVDLEELGPGYKQWVCTRKKYADEGEEAAYWHAYSEPALWGYYARDGVASSLIIDVNGENKYVYVDNDGNNLEYSGESTIHMYNDGATVSFSLVVDKVVSSSGDYLSDQDIQDYFTISGNDSYKDVSINIPANKLSFADGKYYIVYLIGTPESSNINSLSRGALILLFGIKQGESGEDGVSYDLKVSAAAINKQDGTLYPNTVTVSILKSKGAEITNIAPGNYESWEFHYSVDNGATYNAIESNPVTTEGDDGMLFRARYTGDPDNLVLTEYVPIVKASQIEGINGVSYSLQLSDIVLNYTQNSDGTCPFKMTGTVDLYRLEADGSSEKLDNSSAYIQYKMTGEDSKTDLTYSSGSWSLSIEKTLSASSTSVSLYAYNMNGAYFTSMSVPVSAAGKKGEKGEQGEKGDPGSSSGPTGQTFKGSPLRMLGAWVEGKKYYDGKRDAEDGVFYQDVVLYNNMYYACINTETGDTNNWLTPPDSAGWFSAFTISPDIVANLVIANKAFIKELSSNELVIFDDNVIVAGMTSSKAIDDSSALKGNVTSKGDVRIWAGGISNGDLTTAPFAVTSSGDMIAHEATLYDATFYATNATVKISNKLTTDSIFSYERAGLFVSGDTSEYGKAEMFFGIVALLQTLGGTTKANIPQVYLSGDNNKKVSISPGYLNVTGDTYLDGTASLLGNTTIYSLYHLIRKLSSDLIDGSLYVSGTGANNSSGSRYNNFTLPNIALGTDAILINWSSDYVIVSASSGCKLYRTGYNGEVESVTLGKFSMAHAIKVSDTSWFLGIMS